MSHRKLEATAPKPVRRRALKHFVHSYAQSTNYNLLTAGHSFRFHSQSFTDHCLSTYFFMGYYLKAYQTSKVRPISYASRASKAYAHQKEEA